MKSLNHFNFTKSRRNCQKLTAFAESWSGMTTIPKNSISDGRKLTKNWAREGRQKVEWTLLLSVPIFSFLNNGFKFLSQYKIPSGGFEENAKSKNGLEGLPFFCFDVVDVDSSCSTTVFQKCPEAFVDLQRKNYFFR